MKPRVLVIYYSFTHQTRRVAETMAESFRADGCEAEEAGRVGDPVPEVPGTH
jgi:flavodoxin